MNRDLLLVDTALDAATEVDDFVRGVLSLADGRLGGVDEKAGTWSERLTKRLPGGKSIAKQLGASYGPEQLRKAANAADRFVVSVDDLTTAEADTALAAHIDLLESGVQALPSVLREPEVTAGSAELRQAHTTLSRAIGILTEARTRMLLAEMRGRGADPAG